MELDKIQGKFVHQIFRAESGFSVFRFELYELNAKNIIVSGYLPNVEKDILFDLYGNYVEHPKYGMQFKVEYVERVKPNDYDAVIRYLSGPNFIGIGKKYAEMVVNHLGVGCIDLICENPECLNDVPKMTLKRKNAIIEGVNNLQDDSEKIIKYFTIHGLGIRNIMRIEKAYGKDAITKISANPYRMVKELSGIGFATCDKLAISLGFNMDDPKRLEAALVSLVMELCMSSGDTFVLKDGLDDKLRNKLNIDSFDFEDILKNCVLERQLYVEDERVYHLSQYHAEEYISQFLQFFPNQQLNKIDDDILDKGISSIQELFQIEYDINQVEAIKSLFKNDFMILTGGPGTGKTTVVKAMVSLFKKMYPECSLACVAPTGRASKRLSELCDNESYTIHSLLKWDLETNTFGMNEENPILFDLLIIDEFSMVDNYLFYNLLLASKYVKKICIIGDEEQLPSVSPGALLKDLIDSELFSLIRLKKIFRQKEGNDIINLAQDIKHDNIDFDLYNKDVKFFECDNYAIKDIVCSVVQKALDKGYMLSDIQVLSCMYNGVNGIDRLNKALQETFNPKNELIREVKIGYRTFREHDKILQLKNQPDDDVYNGDIGELIEIVFPEEDHNKQLRLFVDFDGVIVEYTSETFQNITLAYCISIHKSQGSEYPIVIMPICKEQIVMLQKKLIYTGITRAKKSLILLGDMYLFNERLSVNENYARKTTLVYRLKHGYFS